MSLIFIITKYLAFIALSGISMLLSYNMFSQLSTVPVESLLLSIVAIAIEALKIFSLVRGNTLLQIKMKKQALRAYAMYGILAILAVLASYGYTLTVVDRGIRASEQSEVQFSIDANRQELQIIEEQIDSLETQIDAAVQRQQETPYDFITAWRNITEQINQLEDSKAQFVTRRLELNTEYATLRTDLAREQTQTQSTVDMFRLMAESFGMSETFLMLALLLTIAILIELGIVSTSPTIPIDKKHMTHILNEFAHNLHLDELEAERALERAKRQQQVHLMYEEAGLQDPNDWPALDRRKSDAEDKEESAPNENLRKLFQDPTDPTLPDDTYAAAYTPESVEEPSFLQAVKSMLPRKKNQMQSTSEIPDDSSEPYITREEFGKQIDASIKSEYNDSGDLIIPERTLPLATSRIEVEDHHYPVREIHRSEPTETIPPAPSWMEPGNETLDEEISLTEEEVNKIVEGAIVEEAEGQPVEVTKEQVDELLAEPEVVKPVRKPRKPRKKKPVEEKIEENEEVPEETVEEETKPKSTPRTRKPKKEAAVEKPAEGTDEADGTEASAEAPKPRRRSRPKPKRTEVSEETSDTSKVEETPEVEPANWSASADKVAVIEEPAPVPKKKIATDEPGELHVRSVTKPQEVGETKTYRFGKTTPEVKKLFVAFLDGLFAENGDEFLVDPSVASRDAKIKPALGNIFIKRLEELKGTTGLALVEQRDDGFYYPNYTKEYIISYTTKEVNTQGRAV